MMGKNKIFDLFRPAFQNVGLTAKDLESIEANIILPHLSAEIELQLRTTGVDIPDIEAALADGTLEIKQPEGYFLYKKRPIFLYIRDQYLTDERIQQRHYDRVHLCFCSSLEKARAEHRFSSRYVASFRRDGIFPVNIYEKYSGWQVAENQQLKLTACQDCLEKLNWHGFAGVRRQVKSYWTKGAQYYQAKQNLYDIVDNFSMKEFLDSAQKKILASLRDLSKQRLHTAASMPRKEYWLFPSQKHRLKKAQQFRCEVCGQVFAEKNLYIHHINHNQGDNNPENLKVVCQTCHRAIHRREGGVFVDDENE